MMTQLIIDKAKIQVVANSLYIEDEQGCCITLLCLDLDTLEKIEAGLGTIALSKRHEMEQE